MPPRDSGEDCELYLGVKAVMKNWALTDLLDEENSVQLHQSVVFINDPVKQLPSTNTRTLGFDDLHCQSDTGGVFNTFVHLAKTPPGREGEE
ncbi:hypothetical protein EYF80_035769 [Liparis tanakae]|uniref:Uncharacterized protein n=1 Tax=Liparis tanakae TaxID=230148 RepID=A0A4Z2GLA6_9TELE|nr:hypothetical protein EYF80_035769 [Liparis tanakae]